MNAPPDLIYPEPRLWVDEPELRQVLTFAFASGIGSDAIERALEKTKQPPSDFPNYAAGSSGPEAADRLLQRDGHAWLPIGYRPPKRDGR